MNVAQFAAVVLVAGTASACNSGGQAAGPQHFLEDALKGDNSEMMLGRMAAQSAASPELRAYGQTLYDDHARALEQATRAARQAGVHITDQPMPEAVEERRKLAGLRGRDFDREFASYMVEDHKKDIAEFEKQAAKGGPAGQLAKDTLPVLRKHLAMAERLKGADRP